MDLRSAIRTAVRDADALRRRRVVDVCDAPRLAGLDAAENLDPIAHTLAHLQLARGELARPDDEHAIHAVAILERGVRDASAPGRPGRFRCARARTCRASTGSPVRHQRLERKRARLRVDRGADARHGRRELLSG